VTAGPFWPRTTCKPCTRCYSHSILSSASKAASSAARRRCSASACATASCTCCCSRLDAVSASASASVKYGSCSASAALGLRPAHAEEGMISRSRRQQQLQTTSGGGTQHTLCTAAREARTKCTMRKLEGLPGSRRSMRCSSASAAGGTPGSCSCSGTLGTGRKRSLPALGPHATHDTRWHRIAHGTCRPHTSVWGRLRACRCWTRHKCITDAP
jgi:hypothetical protein